MGRDGLRRLARGAAGAVPADDGRQVPGGDADPGVGARRNDVVRNEVRNSGADGFHVYELDRNSVLKRNTAIDADDDGFDLESRRATLLKNRALANGDLGFEAVSDLVGHGNVARDNGDPRQCLHVRCR